MITKIVAVFNWLAIGIICLVVAAEALSPNRGGGDAATRGLGQAFFVIAIVAVAVVAALTLLPYRWTKFVAFGVIVLPFLYFQLWPKWQERQRIADNEARYAAEAAAPIFPDQERDAIARAHRDSDLETLKRLLQTPPARINEGGRLLDLAIDMAAHDRSREAEKLEGIRLLFAAGATLDSTKGLDIPPQFSPAATGSVELLRMLLEKGADANAFQKRLEYPLLFEAVSAT